MPDLSPLLSPSSVAVIGASSDASILRGRIMQVLKRRAFDGPIFPVSRSETTVMGYKAYAAIGDIPGPVDLAVLIIPAMHIPAALEACQAKGVKAALVLSSGFSEDQSNGGNDLQRRLREIAAQGGMLIAGPNSEGFANMSTGLCATFSPAVDGEDIVLTPAWSRAGRIAVVAQSGGMGFAFYDRGRQKHLRFSHVVTTGNEDCIESLDVVGHLIDRNEADVFLMFMEDVKTPAKLVAVAERALQTGKPIIVTKIGRSEAGARAAASHTASLAGSYQSYRALFERYGVIEGNDIEEMVDIAAGFSQCGFLLPAGKRVGIFTASGGGGGWLADSCVAAGLEVPMLDAATRAEIDEHLPSYGTSQNPVDGTAGVVHKIGYARICRMIAGSESIDSVIAITSARNPTPLLREKEALAELTGKTGKPVFAWSYTVPDPAATETLARAQLPFFTNMRNCTRALAVMAEYRGTRERFMAGMKNPLEPRRFPRALRERLAAAPEVNAEIEAMGLLAEAGIDAIAGELVTTSEAAGQAAARIAGPVALKIQSRDLPHKSAAGGVILGIAGAAAARAAFDTLQCQVAGNAPAARILGTLVQPMAGDGLEMIIGVENRSGFGPMIMVGFGGTAVEAARDVAFAMAPLDRVAADRLLGSLRGAAVLNKSRLDMAALLDLVVRLSEFAVASQDLIAEIDLNPVLVHAPGAGVSIVDALLIKHRGNDKAAGDGPWPGGET